jgi:integrase
VSAGEPQAPEARPEASHEPTSGPAREPAYDWLWAIEQRRGAYAETTLMGWIDGFTAFEAWCERMGRRALPPAAQDVADFFDALIQTHSVNTMMQRLYAIRAVSLGLELPDPTRTETVRLAVRRGKRLRGVRARQAPPVTQSVLAKLKAGCPDTLRGLRDRAMLSVGYDALCRRAELAALTLEDIVVLPDGTARVVIRRIKQDHGGGVGYLSRATVTEVRAWLEAAQISTGPVFRAVLDRRRGAVVGERPLSVPAISRAIKAAARAARVDPELARRISTHSLRVGAVQDLTVSGASLLQIMRAGRWSHMGQVAYYARNAPVSVWGQTEGDGYPLAQSQAATARRRRVAAHPKGHKLPK